MICLGIESTAHTFGIGIIKDRKILANVKDSYTTEKGGIIPIDAARHHEKIYKKVIEEALEKAKVNKIDLIAYSAGPGLGSCLRVGLKAAEEISEGKTPIIPVNHCIAHLSVGKLVSNVKDPVLLYVSGANTQVIAFEGGRYRIFGETLDQGVGNFLDAFARYMGMGFPGGPKIYEMSLKAKEFIEIPYVVKGMDVSVSGILSNLKEKYDKGLRKEDLAYSCQETVFAMLIEVAERALAHCDKKELLLGGGVCCNERLKEMARKMCEERKARCYIPANDLLLDNGLMIAWQGMLQNRVKKRWKMGINPYERTDEVIVDWL